MTEHTIGGAGDAPPERPANEAELKPALHAVLRGQANSAMQKWKDNANQQVDAQLAHIADPTRRALWKAQMVALIDHLAKEMFEDLKVLFEDSVKDALAELSSVRHDDIMCADVTGARLRTATKDRLGAFTSSTKLMNSLLAALPSADAKLTAFAQRSTTVELHRTTALASYTAAFDELAATVAEADAAVLCIGSFQLTAILEPLTVPLVKHRNVAVPLLQVTPVRLGEQIDVQLGTSHTLSEDQQKQQITNLCTAPISAVVTANLNLCGSVSLVRPEVVDRFTCLSGMGTPALKACTSMVAFYGKPWLMCIGGLEPEEIAQVLVHCQNSTILAALKKRMPAKSTTLELSKAVNVLAWRGVDWDFVCATIHKLGYVEIQCPGGVTALTWIPIHESWVPRAFCTASMETDLACLKHMKEETGKAPSGAKLTMYFAELVAACVEACAQWRHAGRPADFKVVVQPEHGVAVWTIRVRNLYGKPQVFHVDSGYAKSPWVKHPN
ncbi:hypothetical protein ACFZBU_44915 [Embleya sp. NPDC008237]|uniref:hypothetical protein n=1 Tax=Embleya sp. NPDC008237 TaxID=3363978 RepID=UPI0036DFDCE4